MQVLHETNVLEPAKPGDAELKIGNSESGNSLQDVSGLKGFSPKGFTILCSIVGFGY